MLGKSMIVLIYDIMWFRCSNFQAIFLYYLARSFLICCWWLSPEREVHQKYRQIFMLQVTWCGKNDKTNFDKLYKYSMHNINRLPLNMKTIRQIMWYIHSISNFVLCYRDLQKFKVLDNAGWAVNRHMLI